jgi:hypothetical protein
MGACDEEGKGDKVMAMGIRVVVNEEGEGDEEGNGIGNKGGVQQTEQWLWRQERWQQGWWAINGDKGNGNGEGNNVGNGNDDEAGGQQRGQGQGQGQQG